MLNHPDPGVEQRIREAMLILLKCGMTVSGVHDGVQWTMVPDRAEWDGVISQEIIEAWGHDLKVSILIRGVWKHISTFGDGNIRGIIAACEHTIASIEAYNAKLKTDRAF